MGIQHQSRSSPSSHAIFLQILLSLICIQTRSQSSSSVQCNPCLPSHSGFRVKPFTNCVEYVQCNNGNVVGDLKCNGETMFDQSAQYCNWKDSVICDTENQSCPPTQTPADSIAETSTSNPNSSPTAPDNGKMPSGQESAYCPNPCPVDFTGFKTRPGTNCQRYVKCDDGQPTNELECYGDTIFSDDLQYCDWPTSLTCMAVACPERTPTDYPTTMPIVSPVGGGSPIDSNLPMQPPVVEDPDCVNPCPYQYSGYKARPATNCKMYVQCDNGEIVGERSCFGNALFLEEKQYCEFESADTICQPVPCPEPISTSAPSLNDLPSSPFVLPTMAPNPGVTSPIANAQLDCNPCDSDAASTITLRVKPRTQCKKFVECVAGQIVFEGECEDGAFFSEETQQCELSNDILCFNDACSPPTYNDPISASPTTPQPTNTPTGLFQGYRGYLVQNKDSIQDYVFLMTTNKRGEENDSIAYTFEELISSLHVVVYQLPPTTSWFYGQNLGLEYGLVHMAAFLSNAMEEGIRSNSCNEINSEETEEGKFPLSNSCGQYGRSYQEETCREDDAEYDCMVDNEMQIVASTESEQEINNTPPPFSCGPLTGNFPGYYSSITNEVIPTLYSNSLGRTDVQGCCWWGRGVLFTRGTCILGKLNYYLGKRAADAGSFSLYTDTDFCATPEIICRGDDTRELRWVIGLFEWIDRVQSYVDPTSGWNYLDELVKFVDGGLMDENFIDSIINIMARGCHDGLCSSNEIRFKAERKENFFNILFDVLGLPLAQSPTISPIDVNSPSLPSDAVGTNTPTARDVDDDEAIQSNTTRAGHPSSAFCLWGLHYYGLFALLLSISTQIFSSL